jgi:hypothetical protein
MPGKPKPTKRTSSKSRVLIPRSTAQLEGMSNRDRANWLTASKVVHAMDQESIAREKAVAERNRFLRTRDEDETTPLTPIPRSHSLTQVAKEYGTTAETVRKVMKSDLVKNSRGQYRVKPGARYARELLIPTANGTEVVIVNSSKQSNRIAKYWNSVKSVTRGKPSPRLHTFDGVVITDAFGNRIPFITDRTLLMRISDEGFLSLDSIYREGR